jgi:hypothetical protein
VVFRLAAEVFVSAAVADHGEVNSFSSICPTVAEDVIYPSILNSWPAVTVVVVVSCTVPAASRTDSVPLEFTTTSPARVLPIPIHTSGCADTGSDGRNSKDRNHCCAAGFASIPDAAHIPKHVEVFAATILHIVSPDTSVLSYVIAWPELMVTVSNSIPSAVPREA